MMVMPQESTVSVLSQIDLTISSDASDDYFYMGVCLAQLDVYRRSICSYVYISVGEEHVQDGIHVDVDGMAVPPSVSGE